MQRHNVLCSRTLFSFRTNSNRKLKSRTSSSFPSSLPSRTQVRLCLTRGKSSSGIVISSLEFIKCSSTILPVKIRVAGENQGELSDEDDDLCPVDCVREFNTDEEFFKILERAKETDSLVVVDFYRNSCGSCKYIAQGFSKLCKGSGDEEVPVIFLKHNVSILQFDLVWFI